MELYNQRRDFVIKNKAYWKPWQVSERMKAKGIKKGASIGNVKNVLCRKKWPYQNIQVLKAAEEVIQITKQIHIADTIALKTKAEIIKEYEEAVKPYLVLTM